MAYMDRAGRLRTLRECRYEDHMSSLAIRPSYRVLSGSTTCDAIGAQVPEDL